MQWKQETISFWFTKPTMGPYIGIGNGEGRVWGLDAPQNREGGGEALLPHYTNW